MSVGVQELKTTAKMQEWTRLVAACRSSGKGVKEWCAEQGICFKTYYRWEKKVVAAVIQEKQMASLPQATSLVRIDPNALPDNNVTNGAQQIIVQHGESTVTLPAGSDVETVALLVRALNRNV